MSTGRAMVYARKQKPQAKCHTSHAEPKLQERSSTQTASPMHTPVLVLNASYEPINICGARRALVLILKGVARPEEEHATLLHAAGCACRCRR